MYRTNKKDNDAQFEAFLKESLSTDESLDTARLNALLYKEKEMTDDASYWKKEKTSTELWWLQEEDSETAGGTGLSGVSRSYMKKKLDPIMPGKEFGIHVPKESYDSNLSRDSLDSHTALALAKAQMDSAGIRIPNLSLESSTTYTDSGRPLPPCLEETLGHTGIDTLDELADKENFFKAFEEENHSTIDYHRLNRELDQSDTLQPRASPNDGQGNHSKNDAMKPSMLDNVALLDSLDTTLGTGKMLAKSSKDTVDNNDHHGDLHDDHHGDLHDDLDEDDHTGHRGLVGNMGTGLLTTDTSKEMMALQQAYQRVGQSSRQLQPPSGSIHSAGGGATGSLHSAGGGMDSPDEGSRTRETLSFGLRVMAPSDTGADQRRTVDDILREVAEIEGKVQLIRGRDGVDDCDGHLAEADGTTADRGFALSPARVERPGGAVERPCGAVERPGGADRMFHDDYDLVRVIEHSPDPKQTKHKSHTQRPQPAVRRSQTEKSPPKTPDVKVRTSGGSLQKRSPSKENLPSQKTPSKTGSKQPATNDPLGKKSPKKSSLLKKSSPKKRPLAGDTRIFGKVHGELRTGRPVHDELRTGRPVSAADEPELMASVESFARYIRSNFTAHNAERKTVPEVRYSQDEPTLSTSLRVEKVSYMEREKGLMDEVKEWQERWKDERKMLAKCKAEMTSLVKDYKRQLELDRVEHQEEMFKLKQENFVLAAKISDLESRDPSHITSTREGLDELTRQQIGRLEKEIQEQEKLILGYQQENEKLYKDLKLKQVTSKGTEDKMFHENQRLNSEVMNLRAQLEQKEIEWKNKGVITDPSVQRDLAAGTGTAILGAGRIAQLEAEIKELKKHESEFELSHRLQEQAKRDLELHVQRLRQERGVVDDKAEMTKIMADQNEKVLKHEYDQELARLNKKLRWYASNQELLDRDVMKLKRKDEEIQKLQEKIEEITTEHGKKRMETKARLKERTADTKRIMDLERQVKELEGILRKRNPNALPALMYTASLTETKGPTIDFLEKQVRRLEKELETRDDEEKRDIRVLEQKYNAMKFQYEESVERLEKQMRGLSDDHPHTHSTALQKELDSVRERARRTAADKDADIERLHKEITALKSKINGAERSQLARSREAESELELRVKVLQQELVNRDENARQLEEQIRKLTTEKNLMVIDSALHQDRHIKEAAIGKKGKLGKVTGPASREYEPDQFRGLHISDVMTQNEDLKLQLERCHLELNQQRVDLSKALADKESSVRKMQENLEDQICALMKQHKSEVESLVTQHAMQHSTSRTAELQAKLETQELMTSHLKEQYDSARHKAEEASVLKIREAALNAQVQQLVNDLREAKRNHTPEMHHYDQLLSKIRQMESRQGLRDADLEQIMDRNKRIATAQLEKENTKWRKIVEAKNDEVKRFREELDSMLEVLRQLQRQGVVLPSYTIKA